MIQSTHVSWRGALHASGALVFISGALVFAASAQGIPLDHLSLVAEGTFVPGSHRTVEIIEMVFGKLLPPRHFTDSGPRHTLQSFCERGLFACPGALAWGAVFRFGTHFVVSGPALKEHRLQMSSWHSPSALLQFTGVTQKRAYTLIWSPDLCDCHSGTPPDCLALVDSRTYAYSPTELYIFAYL